MPVPNDRTVRVPWAGIDDAEPLGRCPCGKEIFATRRGGVVHELPYCRAFYEKDVLEFLRYVRRSRGIPDEAVDAGQ
jgi:hypothetical protein